MIFVDQYIIYIIASIIVLSIFMLRNFYIRNASLEEENEALREDIAINMAINSLSVFLKHPDDLHTKIESIIIIIMTLLELDGILVLIYSDDKYEKVGNVFNNNEVYALLECYCDYTKLQDICDLGSGLGILNYKISDESYLSVIVQQKKIDQRQLFILSYFIIDQEVTKDNIAEYYHELLLGLLHLIIAAFENENKIMLNKVLEEKLLTDNKNIELAEKLSRELEYKVLQNDFISMASHEFRTPLAVMGSSIYLIQRYSKHLYEWMNQKNLLPSNPEVDADFVKINNMAAKIHAYINHLSSMINSTLSIAVMEERGIKNNMIALDLAEEVLSIIEKIKDLRSDVEIIFNNACNNAEIMFDKCNVEHVLTNLISNALKYSKPNSNILIILQPKGNSIIMSIQDYGIGIPRKQRSRLFSKFFRASNTTGVNGIGVGLYLTKKLIDLNSASIKVKSQEGVGSTFYVTFQANRGNHGGV